jgi:hypothetical protein
MTADPQLMQLLADWRRLTQEETQAIAAEDWSALTGHQYRKAELQEAISRALIASNATAQARADLRPALPKGVGTMVRDLISLEEQNSRLLRDRQQQRLAEAQRASCTVRDLQQMRRAYRSPLAPHWQSYS